VTRRTLIATAFVASALAIGCSGPSNQHVRLGSLGFDVPGGWHNVDEVRRGVVTSVWTPDGNDRKESVTVIRTELAPNVANASAGLVAQLAEQAQRSLTDARITQAVALSTAGGLSGVRIEVDYVPPGLHERYHRVHIVLVDKRTLVHVLYTAHEPDAHSEAFNLVLRSIREEG
jgi:hypothetical protein